MPELALAEEWYSRSNGQQAPIAFLNMILEQSKSSPSGFVRLSRYGLVPYATVGSGPINGTFAKSGVFGHELFTLSGSTLYRSSTSLGAIAGSGPVSFAASASEVVVARGGAASSYNGTNLATITFPDGAAVTAVAFLNGLFFYLRAGTHRIYWSSTLDGRTIDGLDYVSAESEPDALLDIYKVQDGLWVMGSSSVEFFQYTGDADAPISRVEGLLYTKGIRATGCAARLDNTLYWWGVDENNDDFIYRGAGGAPEVVSNPAVEAWLSGSTLKDVYSFTHQGHPLLAVRTDSGTLIFDVRVQKWYQWQTFGETNWRAQNSAALAGNLVFGDDETGTLWQFDEANWDDGSHLERRFTAGFPVIGGSVPVHRLGVIANSGQTLLLAGLGSEPVMEMRASRDGGQTWGPWRQVSLGEMGQYRAKVETRVWGRFEAPGGLFEFRCTDPIPLAVTSSYANEQGGGRSRAAA